MGNSEEAKPVKPEKPSSPSPDQTNIHVYPDWAAMQAYYGPRVAMPPYFNSAVASGHPPHPYMWGPPQPMMPPYGTPYAAIYAHGGVYTHAGVPLGSPVNGHGVASSHAASDAMTAVPLSVATPAKSSVNNDRGLINKLKGFDGLAIAIGNGNAASGEGGADHGVSQSKEAEGSSDGSDGNTTRVALKSKKRSREGTASSTEEGKTSASRSPIAARVPKGSSEEVLGITVAPASAAHEVVGAVLSPNMNTNLELRNPSGANSKSTSSNVPQSCAGIPNETWLQSERELKRERRKQSNRESARRSRLRKQAETEELSKKVQSLTAENITLKSEINKLTENSEHLRLENASLMEKLKSGHSQSGDTSLNKFDKMRFKPVSTADLLARVNSSASADRNGEEGEVCENKNSGAKLRQLLDANPRADPVAAG